MPPYDKRACKALTWCCQMSTHFVPVPRRRPTPATCPGCSSARSCCSCCACGRPAGTCSLPRRLWPSTAGAYGRQTAVQQGEGKWCFTRVRVMLAMCVRHASPALLVRMPPSSLQPATKYRGACCALLQVSQPPPNLPARSPAGGAACRGTALLAAGRVRSAGRAWAGRHGQRSARRQQHGQGRQWCCCWRQWRSRRQQRGQPEPGSVLGAHGRELPGAQHLRSSAAGRAAATELPVPVRALGLLLTGRQCVNGPWACHGSAHPLWFTTV